MDYPTLFRPAQARALAAERGEESQRAALSICEHSLTYTCERPKFHNFAMKVIA